MRTAASGVEFCKQNVEVSPLGDGRSLRNDKICTSIEVTHSPSVSHALDSFLSEEAL